MTKPPWFRGGYRETKKWLRHIRQLIRSRKAKGLSTSALEHEDLPCAEEALERCIRQKQRKQKEDEDE